MIPSASAAGKKLVCWMAHVDTYGLPAEYNSPNYASVAVRVLGRLAELTEDEHTRIRAPHHARSPRPFRGVTRTSRHRLLGWPLQPRL